MSEGPIVKDICKFLKCKRKSNRTNQSFWNNELNDLFKEACKAEKLYSRCIGPEKTEYHRIFKQKRSVFDKKLRKIKNLFMRNTEIEIESMVRKSGKDMWLKLEEIGPLKGKLYQNK